MGRVWVEEAELRIGATCPSFSMVPQGYADNGDEVLGSHTTMAYAILRHNGVDLGKMDYIGSIPTKEG